MALYIGSERIASSRPSSYKVESYEHTHSINDIQDEGIPIARMKTLWTNPNPDSEFNSQTVTISKSLADFDYIMVIATTDPPSSLKQYIQSSWVPVGTGNYGLVSAMTVDGWSHARSFTIRSNTTIEFSDPAMYQHVAGGHNIYTTYLARAIPQRIIGIRIR